MFQLPVYFLNDDFIILNIQCVFIGLILYKCLSDSIHIFYNHWFSISSMIFSFYHQLWRSHCVKSVSAWALLMFDDDDIKVTVVYRYRW